LRRTVDEGESMPGRIAILLLALIAHTAAAQQPARLDGFEVVDLPSLAERASLALAIEGYGQRWQLMLHRHEAPFSRLSALQRDAIARGGSRFFTGRLEGRPGSWVRLNWIGGRWSGGFHDGETLYLIDRASAFDFGSRQRPGADDTILFRIDQLHLHDLVGHDPLLPGPGLEALPGEGSGARGATESMPVTVVADVFFADTHGEDAPAIVAGRINLVDGIYASQLGTGIVLEHLEILSSNGPLTATGASELLGQFRAYMSSGDGSDIPFAGLGHLFTSRSRDGSIAGIAYLGVLCSSFAGYGVDWDTASETTNSLVFAHELGHNFDAPHDGAPGTVCESETFDGIMNATINGSDQFSDCSLQVMSEAVARAGCLVSTPDQAVIFGDRFRAPGAP
jgi:hypothetical protein